MSLEFVVIDYAFSGVLMFYGVDFIIRVSNPLCDCSLASIGIVRARTCAFASWIVLTFLCFPYLFVFVLFLLTESIQHISLTLILQIHGAF